MAHSLNKLSARFISTVSAKGRYADGGGLYLQVGTTAEKSWLFRFQLNGRARAMGLGPVHTVSLADAREHAFVCRRQVLDGKDPIEERRRERLAGITEAAEVRTFQWCAESNIKSHNAAWNNLKHAQQWTNTLTRYVFPAFGRLPVASIETHNVLEALEPIWTTKPETASRVRGRVEAVLDWTKVRGLRNGENPARWRGHLDKLLPAPSKVAKPRHHAALPFDDAPAFMVDLKQRDAIAARGLEFLILTAARTGEVIGAKWDEIDADVGIWTVPAERMKAGKEHRVPLSKSAAKLIETMTAVRMNDYVFPGTRPKSPLSNMAFLQLLKRMQCSGVTPHGFRSTFRDWASERTTYPSEVAEQALAHTISSKVEAAYRRSDLFEKRRAMLQDWDNFLFGKS